MVRVVPLYIFVAYLFERGRLFGCASNRSVRVYCCMHDSLPRDTGIVVVGGSTGRLGQVVLSDFVLNSAITMTTPTIVPGTPRVTTGNCILVSCRSNGILTRGSVGIQVGPTDLAGVVADCIVNRRVRDNGVSVSSSIIVDGGT